MTLFSRVRFGNPSVHARNGERKRAIASLRFQSGFQPLEARHLMDGISLGAAADFAVLAVTGSTISITNPQTTINGNVGLGPDGTQNFADGTIDGNYEVDPTANNAKSNNVVVTGSTSVTDLRTAVNDAISASTAISGLTATQSLGAINGSQTITGNGGVNVIDVSQISLSGSNVLAIDGGPNDLFYINDPGTFQMSGPSSIQLNGVTPDQVIFNLAGNGSVQFSGSSVGQGIFLAVDRDIARSNGVLDGALIGHDIAITSAAQINFTPPQPSQPSITTTPGGDVTLGSGADLNDSATLSSGTNPTGTITFYLFAPGVTPNGSDSNNVYSDTVSVSGDGTYSTSTGTNPGGYLPTTTGIYQWVAVYSGDQNNNSATSPFGDEPECVTSPSNPQPTQTPLELYVQSAFEQILGRQVDPTSEAAFVNALASGQMSQLAFTETLTHCDEYYDNVITQAYQHYLGRTPDAAGRQYWCAALEQGLTDEEMDAQFIGSSEYYQHSGGTDQSWVDEMYFDLLGRSPDAQGQAYWVGQLAAGASRSSVALGFAAGAEREGIIVQDDYQTYLGRSASQSEVAGWVQAFELGLENEEVIAGFVASDEYFAQHS